MDFVRDLSEVFGKEELMDKQSVRKCKDFCFFFRFSVFISLLFRLIVDVTCLCIILTVIDWCIVFLGTVEYIRWNVILQK